MTDLIKSVFENRIVSQLIVMLIIGIFSFYVGTIKSESNVKSELKIMEVRLKAIEGEIALLKIKQDQMHASIEMKADKGTIDQCLINVNEKLDQYNNDTNKRLDRIMELIIDRNK